MKLKIQRAALIAQKLGYQHIASVVKSYYSTTYYNINSVESVIKKGWTPAPFSCGDWTGRIGQSNLPPKTILRTQLFDLI